MTTLNTTYASRTTTTFFGHFGQSISAILGSIATWYETRATRKALNKLTDRQLEDIGLCRGDIHGL